MSNKDLTDSLRKSFEYWSAVDEDSPINCLLVWRKILRDNSNILKNQTILINNSRENAESMIQNFLESWSKAIQESDFEAAKKSIQNSKEIWRNTIEENFKIYDKVLETLQTTWENIQSKNIE